MTNNQLKAREIKENARANAAREAETTRANKAYEAETRRSNTAREKETSRSNRAQERNQKWSNNANALLGLGKQIFDIVKTGATLYGAANDPEFYDHNPELTKGAANISYNAALGSLFPSTFPGMYMAAPGLCTLDVILAIGDSLNRESAVNVAARNSYSFIRNYNSGAKNYEAPDLMMFYIAMSNAYAMHGELARLYKILKTYSAENRYYGRAMTYAMDYDYDDLIGHINDLRSFVNMLRIRLTSLRVPSVFPIFKRHYYLTSVVLADSPDAHDQLYAYRPYGFLTFDGSDISALKLSKYIGIGTGKGGTKTYNDIVKYANKLVTDLFVNEDINIMSGDVIKAYGDKLAELPIVGEDDTLPIIDSDLERTQLMNTTLINCGENRDDFRMTVEQDETDGAIIAIYEACLTEGTSWYLSDTVKRTVGEKGFSLFRTEQEYQGAELLEAIENMTSLGDLFAYEETSNKLWTNIKNVSSTICVKAHIHFTAPSQETGIYSVEPHLFQRYLPWVAAKSNFDYFPTQYVLTNEDKTSTNQPIVPNCWLGNYKFMSNYEIGNMKQVSIYSLFAIPQK